MNKNRKEPIQFDAIIVYNGSIASSAKDETYTGSSPFSIGDGCHGCDQSYAYFLQEFKKQGLTAAFATTDDVCGPGIFTSVWTFEDTWKREPYLAQTSLIFDKFSVLNEFHKKEYELLTSGPEKVTFFHNPQTRLDFNDKLKIFTLFPNIAIPTVAINPSSEKSIIVAQKNLHSLLKEHLGPSEITNTFVMKDQFGVGGTRIHKLKDIEEFISVGNENPSTSYVLQPFIDASGFKLGKYTGTMDLRAIIFDKTIIQSYIRIPKKGDFRANASKGADLLYIDVDDIPQDVVDMTKKIGEALKGENAFYSLDFVKSSGGHLFFIEGNITPGITWYNDEDEIRAKELISLIINSMKVMLEKK